MQIAHISDWHTNAAGAVRILNENAQTHNYKNVELVLITGDMLYDPIVSSKVKIMTPDLIQDQRWEWEEAASVIQERFPRAKLVAVPGNHDWCNYGIPDLVTSFDEFGPLPAIEVAGVRIAGFRGVPMFYGFYHGEFSDRYFHEHIFPHLELSDILLTHAPPHGILDDVIDARRIGIMGLEEWFTNHPWHRRRLHCFGHVHERGGAFKGQGEVYYSNAAGAINFLNF
jgi:Icc-related predicted phosphoesterase